MTGLSVAVCTRNRSSVLRQCLASLDRQLDPSGVVDILVVDNGSTDDTAALLHSWARGARRLAISEPRIGLSVARNAALSASDKEIVLFVDDDALAPTTLARAHLDAHACGARVGAVGGPVGLTWPSGRPEWMTDELTGWYSALDLGDGAGPYPNEHGPYGTNMSVRRLAALSVGGFDPRFGRRGRRLISGEERDLTRRLVGAGWSIVYAPAAAVVQQVLAERISRRWLLRRGWAQGITNARFALSDASPSCVRRGRMASDALRLAARVAPVRRSQTSADLAAWVITLAHLGSAIELARSMFSDPGALR